MLSYVDSTILNSTYEMGWLDLSACSLILVNNSLVIDLPVKTKSSMCSNLQAQHAWKIVKSIQYIDSCNPNTCVYIYIYIYIYIQIIYVLLLQFSFWHANLRPKQGLFHLTNKQVPFGMAIENLELIHECSPKLFIVTGIIVTVLPFLNTCAREHAARMKQDKVSEEQCKMEKVSIWEIHQGRRNAVQATWL